MAVFEKFALLNIFCFDYRVPVGCGNAEYGVLQKSFYNCFFLNLMATLGNEPGSNLEYLGNVQYWPERALVF